MPNSQASSDGCIYAYFKNPVQIKRDRNDVATSFMKKKEDGNKDYTVIS